MTAPTQSRPLAVRTEQTQAVDFTRTNERSVRLSRQIPWLVAILVAAIIAVAAAVASTGHHVTRPPTNTGTTQQMPNANAREGRVATTPVPEPNANTREGRVSTPPVELPNANTRESRVSSNR